MVSVNTRTPVGSVGRFRSIQETKDLLEYVVVHEMAHLLAPTHSERFIAILDDITPHGARPALN